MNRSVPSSFRTVHSVYLSELELKLRFLSIPTEVGARGFPNRRGNHPHPGRQGEDSRDLEDP